MLSKPRKKSRLDPPMAVPAEKAADDFPAVRYFQIHFEFLQEQIQLILRNQEALQQHMQQLESQLSRSAQGIRLNSKALSPIERLTANRNAPQDSETPNLASLEHIATDFLRSCIENDLSQPITQSQEV